MTSTASTEIWRDIRPYLDSEVHDAVEQLFGRSGVLLPA